MHVCPYSQILKFVVIFHFNIMYTYTRSVVTIKNVHYVDESYHAPCIKSLLQMYLNKNYCTCLLRLLQVEKAQVDLKLQNEVDELTSQLSHLESKVYGNCNFIVEQFIMIAVTSCGN